MDIRGDLITAIETYLEAQRAAGNRMTEKTFGRLAVNDGKFMQFLRDGKNIGINTVDKVRAYIAANPATSPSQRDAA